MKVKNVRAGIVIIADAGIKLAPGETVEIENPTRQVQTAIIGGILAEVDTEPEVKPKAKTSSRATEGKQEPKKTAGSHTSPEQPGTSKESPLGQSAEAGQGQLIGAGDASK